ncbi:MAG: hypothetical protein OHK0029_38000 [Armatimonadaceae bacterium]
MVSNEQIQDALSSVMRLPGALGIALVDLGNAAILGSVTKSDVLDIEKVSVGSMGMVRSNARTLELLDLDLEVEDILIQLHSQYHIIRTVQMGEQRAFLFFALNRSKANLGLARIRLGDVESKLVAA